MHRQKYFKTLDVLCEEINRFDQKDLKVVADIERLLLDSANGIPRDIPESITTTYRGNIDKERLFLHLQMLPDAISQYTIKSQQYTIKSAFPIRKITSVRTLCDVLNFGGTKHLMSQVHILLQVFFITIPVTTATLERTFSALRRLKTYLQTTIGQECLNHLLLLYCHKARNDAIDFSRIASTFCVWK